MKNGKPPISLSNFPHRDNQTRFGSFAAVCVSVRLNKIIQRKYNGKIQTIIHERELCEEEKFSSIYEKKKDRERKKIEIISCYY